MPAPARAAGASPPGHSPPPPTEQQGPRSPLSSSKVRRQRSSGQTWTCWEVSAPLTGFQEVATCSPTNKRHGSHDRHSSSSRKLCPTPGRAQLGENRTHPLHATPLRSPSKHTQVHGHHYSGAPTCSCRPGPGGPCGHHAATAEPLLEVGAPGRGPGPGFPPLAEHFWTHHVGTGVTECIPRQTDHLTNI